MDLDPKTDDLELQWGKKGSTKSQEPARAGRDRCRVPAEGVAGLS